MQSFLIHRDQNGQIVLAIPYAGIAELRLRHDCYEGVDEWNVLYMLQNGHGNGFNATKIEAERYLSEWRAWWEHSLNTSRLQVEGVGRYGEKVIAVQVGGQWLPVPDEEE